MTNTVLQNSAEPRLCSNPHTACRSSGRCAKNGSRPSLDRLEPEYVHAEAAYPTWLALSQESSSSPLVLLTGGS